MGEYCPELIEQAMVAWQPYTDEPLTREDARQILDNTTALFRILIEWDRKERNVDIQDEGTQG